MKKGRKGKGRKMKKKITKNQKKKREKTKEIIKSLNPNFDNANEALTHRDETKKKETEIPTQMSSFSLRCELNRFEKQEENHLFVLLLFGCCGLFWFNCIGPQVEATV